MHITARGRCAATASNPTANINSEEKNRKKLLLTERRVRWINKNVAVAFPLHMGNVFVQVSWLSLPIVLLFFLTFCCTVLAVSVRGHFALSCLYLICLSNSNRQLTYCFVACFFCRVVMVVAAFVAGCCLLLLSSSFSHVYVSCHCQFKMPFVIGHESFVMPR